MRFFLIITISVALFGCKAEPPPEHVFLAEEATKSEQIKIYGLGGQSKQENCQSIKNQAFVDLTLTIKRNDFNDKVKQCATKTIVFLKNKVIPLLEANKAINREITVKKSATMLDVMEKQIWSKALTQEESNILLNSLKPSFQLVGFPDLTDESKLLGDDDSTIAHLLCFLEGVEEALKLYYDRNRYEILQEETKVKPTKEQTSDKSGN